MRYICIMHCYNYSIAVCHNQLKSTTVWVDSLKKLLQNPKTSCTFIKPALMPVCMQGNGLLRHQPNYSVWCINMDIACVCV